MIIPPRLACVVAAALLAAGLRAETDYATFPPIPSEASATLAESKVTLGDAITAAEAAVEGVASAAHRDVTGETQQIEIRVYAAEKLYRVVVDGKSGEVIEKEEVPAFPGTAVSGKPETTPSGLRYYDIKVGEGPQPESSSARVKVHYSGWLVNGQKFDSSVDRGEPVSFPLDRVIPGWTEGVQGMKVGGKRKLLIPFELAYGVSGRPPVIPQKAALIFDVELLAIEE